MRLTVSIFFTFLLHVSANTYSQRVSLTGKNIPLKQVFDAIERQTGYMVFTSKELLQSAKSITIDATDMPLGDFLDMALRGQPLIYLLEGKSITLYAKPQWTTIFAAADPVKGQVLDMEGRPLAGASVRVKGRREGILTDVNGNFSLSAAEKDVIIVSYIGYMDIAVNVTAGKENDPQVSRGQNGITIRLKTSESKLAEVTINGGYYKTDDIRRTGSITRIAAKEIQDQPVTSLLMALQGRVTGLEITPDNGTPGSAPKVRVRGQTSLRNDGGFPLYIIDGIPVESSPVRSSNSGLLNGNGFDPLNTINPSSIQSIEVLKDADATAIYGSRGANGVILITTKKSSNKGKAKVDARVYKGAGKFVKKIELLNREEYLTMRREAFAFDGITPGEFDYDLNGMWDTTRYTNWQETLLGQTAGITDVDVALDGGNEQTSFRIGTGWHKETSLYSKAHGTERYNGNFNLQHSSTDQKLKISFNASYGAVKNKLFDDSGYGYAIFLPPVAPPLYTEDGKLNWEEENLFGGTYVMNTWNNPYNYFTRQHENKSGTWAANTSISYQLLPDLQLSMLAGYNEMHSNEIIQIPIAYYSPASRPYVTGESQFGNTTRSTWNIEPQLNYTKKWNAHTLSVLAGATMQRSINDFSTLRGTEYTSDAFLKSFEAAPVKSTGYGGNSDYRYIAGHARINYNIGDRYIASLTGRRDGSSRFGPGRQFGNFGSVGVAWIFSNESFIRDHGGFLSFGKLRASYGTNGSDQIGDYKFYDTYTFTNLPYANTINLIPTALFNPNFAWELTRKMDIALQAGFLENRINLEMNWYRNRSSNQLVGMPVPFSTGFTDILVNSPATIQNTGFEFMLSADITRNSKLKWNTSLNLSVPRNKLVAFPDIEQSVYATVYKVGEPLSIRRLFIWEGVDPQTGLHKIKDKNGDGSLTYEDQDFMAPLDQKVFGGMQHTLGYKNITLSMLFQFSIKEREYMSSNMPGTKVNFYRWVLRRWQKPGDITDVGAFSQYYENGNNYNMVSSGSGNVTDASFIRLKTLSISYDLPGQLLNKAGLNNMRVYAQGQNLLTFTRYPNMDPETGDAMPPLRILTAGLQLTL